MRLNRFKAVILEMQKVQEDFKNLQRELATIKEKKQKQSDFIAKNQTLTQDLKLQLWKLKLQLNSLSAENDQLYFNLKKFSLILVLYKIIEKRYREEDSKTRLGQQLEKSQTELKKWKNKARCRRLRYKKLKKELLVTERKKSNREKSLEKELEAKNYLLEEIKIQVLRARLSDTFLSEEDGSGWKTWKIYVSRVTDLANWLMEKLPPTTEELELIETQPQQRTLIRRLACALYRIFPERKKNR